MPVGFIPEGKKKERGRGSCMHSEFSQRQTSFPSSIVDTG